MNHISEGYLEEQKLLHKNPNYGVASIGFAPLVKEIIMQTQIRDISDYGAGKCNLKKSLDKMGITGIDYYPYDPVFPEYGAPKAADLVCCFDVLEHIEEDFLVNVLNDLKKITVKLGLFSIHTGPAQKTLSDGRNAHIIQQPSSWWLPKLCERFEIMQLQQSPGGFWMLVEPRKS